MFRKPLLHTAFSLLLACATVAASASPYTSITVFGDSLSDGGNLFALTGFPPFPYAQRFSNGPVAVERLASNLGIALTPSLLGGTNYAFGGAETGTQNYLSPSLIGTGVLGLAQVPGFTSTHTLNASSLVVLWAGPNDLFAALDAASDPVAAMQAALANLQLAAQLLYADGARTILMPNMPDIGATPYGLSLGPANSAALTAVSQFFDAQLHLLAGSLEAADSGLNILEFDTFGLLHDAISNPAAYGLTNVTQPCFNGVSVCADPNTYLYWDDVHPTAAVHQVLGDLFTVTVPEPPMTVLIAVALIAVSVSRRRKQ